MFAKCLTRIEMAAPVAAELFDLDGPIGFHNNIFFFWRDGVSDSATSCAFRFHPS